MKRIFIILISLTLALLSGCSNEPKSNVNQNTESSTVQETVSSTSSENAPNSDIQNTETKPSTSNTTSSKIETTTSEESHNTETSTNSVYKNPDIDYATAEDIESIADRLIKLINEYRINEGACTTVKLSRLTEHAKMRPKMPANPHCCLMCNFGISRTAIFAHQDMPILHTSKIDINYIIVSLSIIIIFI